MVELFEDSIEVHAPAGFCYRRWRNFSELPLIFHNIRSIFPLGEGIWRWEIFDHLGDTNNWDLLLADDVPDKRIIWQTLAGPEQGMKAEVNFQAISTNRTRIVVTVCTQIENTLTGKVLNELFGIKSPTIALNLSEFRQAVESDWPLERQKANRQPPHEAPGD